MQIYSKDAGRREAEIGFNIGQGTQNIGFRNTISVLFNIVPADKIVLHVKDEDGSPAMASFVITDRIERILDASGTAIGKKIDYRFTMAQLEYWGNLAQCPWLRCACTAHWYLSTSLTPDGGL